MSKCNSSFLHQLFLIMLFSFVYLLPCEAMPPLDLNKIPVAPDYEKAESWLVKPGIIKAKVDVFFVYPTILFNDKDWVMDTDRADMRDAAMDAVKTQASVFDGQANIYAPMYRQMNLAGLTLSDADAAPIQKIVHDDVWNAFDYYLKHENNGRPFFLAGHSQGSMILTDILLKYWGKTGAEDRLIAALLPGWSLTPADIKTNSNIKICKSSDETGCAIYYNTVAKGRQSAAPTLRKGTYVVNPLSWTMDSGFVSEKNNIGSVFFDKDNNPTKYPYFTSAQIVDSGLVVNPSNLDLVTVKGGHFPAGVYHAFDYSLFYENIKENIAERIAAFKR